MKLSFFPENLEGTTKDDVRTKIKGLFNEQKFDQVIQFLTEELQHNTFKPEYYVDRANAYYLLGEIHLAIQDANSAIQYSADLVEAYEIRAKTFSKFITQNFEKSFFGKIYQNSY